MKKTGFRFFAVSLLLFVIVLPAGCMKRLSGRDAPGVLSLPSDRLKVDVAASAQKLPHKENAAGNPAQAELRARNAGGVAAAFPGFFYHNVTLTEDTEWFGDVTVEGALTVAPQATLTIVPGTVVRFSSEAIMFVQGRIIANGTSDKPVVFRSNLPVAKVGDWQGIVLLASEKKNLLEHCRVEGAEIGLSGGFSSLVLKNTLFTSCRAGLRFQDCFVRISGGGAGKCDLGLNLYDSEADVEGANFSQNRIGIAVQRSSLALSGSVIADNTLEAVTAEESRIVLRENSISQNGSGITLSSSEGLVSRNRINKNMNYGISLSGSRVKVCSNDITQNRVIGIRVADGKSIAWGNAIAANGRYDLYNAGSENFMAIGNWWGDVKAPDVAGRIYSSLSSSVSGRVHYVPVLERKPEITP